MFDRIFDFIAAVWEWFIPFTVINAYEQGVVLRFGKFHHVVKPGLRWLIPFGIDEVKYETVVRQTSYLDVQSLTTKDKKSISIAGIIVYKIDDIRMFLLDIDDGEVDMNNIVYGIISEHVEKYKWEDVLGAGFHTAITRATKRACNKYCGVKVIAIKWSDKTVARSLRLWND